MDTSEFTDEQIEALQALADGYNDQSVNRRDVMKLVGAGGVGALLGGGGAASAVDQVSAGTAQSGQLGTVGDPLDLVTEDVMDQSGNVVASANAGALEGPDLQYESVNAGESRTASHPVIDVTHPDYGAAGDGSTDDVGAINQAITDATPGGTVRLVNNDFAISEPIDAHLAHGVTIEFFGGAALVPSDPTTSHDGIAIYDQADETGSLMTEDLTIKSPKFVGNNTKEPWEIQDAPGIANCIRGYNVDNLTVKDPHFEAVTKGIRIHGGENGPSKNISVSDVYADHVASHVVEFTRTFTSVHHSTVEGVRARFCGNDDPAIGADGLIINFSTDVSNSTATDVVVESSNNLVKGQGKNCTFSNFNATNMGGFGIIAQNSNQYDDFRISWRNTNLLDVTRSVSVTGNDVQMSNILLIEPKFQIKASEAANWTWTNGLVVSTSAAGGTYLTRIEDTCSNPKFENVEFRHSQTFQNVFRDDSDNGSYSNCRWFWDVDVLGPFFTGSSVAIVGNQFEDLDGTNDQVNPNGDGTFVGNVVDANIGDLSAYETAANQIITQ